MDDLFSDPEPLFPFDADAQGESEIDVESAFLAAVREELGGADAELADFE